MNGISSFDYPTRSISPLLTIEQDPSTSSLTFNFKKIIYEIMKIEVHKCVKIEHTIELEREPKKKKKNVASEFLNK